MIHITEYSNFLNMELSFVTIWTNVSFCLSFDMTNKFYKFLSWQCFRIFNVAKCFLLQNVPYPKILSINCVTISANVSFLFLNMTDRFWKYLDWCFSKILHFPKYSIFKIFHIPKFSILQNSPYYRILCFPKYRTKFCDNMNKCFVMHVL